MLIFLRQNTTAIIFKHVFSNRLHFSGLTLHVKVCTHLLFENIRTRLRFHNLLALQVTLSSVFWSRNLAELPSRRRSHEACLGIRQIRRLHKIDSLCHHKKWFMKECLMEVIWPCSSMIVAFVGIRHLTRFKNPRNNLLSLSVKFKFWAFLKNTFGRCEGISLLWQKRLFFRTWQSTFSLQKVSLMLSYMFLRAVKYQQIFIWNIFRFIYFFCNLVTKKLFTIKWQRGMYLQRITWGCIHITSMLTCQWRIQGGAWDTPTHTSLKQLLSTFIMGLLPVASLRAERSCLINPGSAPAFYTTESFWLCARLQ